MIFDRRQRRVDNFGGGDGGATRSFSESNDKRTEGAHSSECKPMRQSLNHRRVDTNERRSHCVYITGESRIWILGREICQDSGGLGTKFSRS